MNSITKRAVAGHTSKRLRPLLAASLQHSSNLVETSQKRNGEPPIGGTSGTVVIDIRYFEKKGYEDFHETNQAQKPTHSGAQLQLAQCVFRAGL